MLYPDPDIPDYDYINVCFITLNAALSYPDPDIPDYDYINVCFITLNAALS